MYEVERSWAFGSVVSKVSLALSVMVDRRRTQLGFRFGCCVWASKLVWCCRGVAYGLIGVGRSWALGSACCSAWVSEGKEGARSVPVVSQG